MRFSLLVLFVVGTLAAARQATDDASKKDIEKMQGDWAALSFTRDGQKFSDDDAQVLFRTVKGNEYTVFRFKEPVGKGTFSVDATKKPKTIDFQPSAQPGQPDGTPKPMLGIYEFEDGKLKVCMAGPGRDRPTEFVSKMGNGLTLVVWEREKK
jgi:uncharacterized protein (TIGR03067 family)